MFYHVGAGRIRMDTGIASGISRGLGGRIAFSVSPRIRIGAMGFSTGFTYRSVSAGKGSYVDLSFGGITLEYGIPLKRVRISGGLLAGMGTARQLHIIGEETNLKIVTYEKYTTWIFMPMGLLEVQVSESLSLAFLADWVTGTALIAGKSYGPRIHIGLLFNR